MLCRSEIVMVVAWSWLGLHDIEDISCEGRGKGLLQRRGLCMGTSIIGCCWPGDARAVEQSSEQRGVTKVRVCIKMSNDSGSEVLHSTILRKTKNTRDLL